MAFDRKGNPMWDCRGCSRTFFRDAKSALAFSVLSGIVSSIGRVAWLSWVNGIKDRFASGLGPSPAYEPPVPAPGTPPPAPRREEPKGEPVTRRKRGPKKDAKKEGKDVA